MKLALGTAQFGMNYGVSNKFGKTTDQEIDLILNTAQTNNIKIIDTAPVYGDSEKILGEKIQKYPNFNIVTKIPNLNIEKVSQKEISKILDSIEKSLNNLNLKNLYGVLFHNVNDVFSKNGDLLFNKLKSLKEKKIIDKIGFSVYSQSQIDLLLKYFEFDLIQLPINILDQRLLANNYLKKLKKFNIEIHVRSVFLQGLLLMHPQTIPSYFNPIKDLLSNYHKYINDQNISSTEFALNFAKNIEEIDYIIVGINNNKQLQENIDAYNREIKNLNFTQFSCNDENFINPINWKT